MFTRGRVSFCLDSPVFDPNLDICRGCYSESATSCIVKAALPVWNAQGQVSESKGLQSPQGETKRLNRCDTTKSGACVALKYPASAAAWKHAHLSARDLPLSGTKHRSDNKDDEQPVSRHWILTCRQQNRILVELARRPERRRIAHR